MRNEEADGQRGLHLAKAAEASSRLAPPGLHRPRARSASSTHEQEMINHLFYSSNSSIEDSHHLHPNHLPPYAASQKYLSSPTLPRSVASFMDEPQFDEHKIERYDDGEEDGYIDDGGAESGAASIYGFAGEDGILDEVDHGSVERPYYLPQGITEIDDSELEELLYSSEDEDVAVVGGEGSGVPLVPHAAKYQALSLRASGGNAPQYRPKEDAVNMPHPLQQPIDSAAAIQASSRANRSSEHVRPHYYNYFEDDSAESGDNSHASLPWAPGLNAHSVYKNETDDAIYRSADSLFIQDFADILQSRGAKTSASMGDIPLYMGSPTEHLADDDRLRNIFQSRNEQRRELEPEASSLFSWGREERGKTIIEQRRHSLDRDVIHTTGRKDDGLVYSNGMANSTDALTPSSAGWSRAVGGGAATSVYRQASVGNSIHEQDNEYIGATANQSKSMSALPTMAGTYSSSSTNATVQKPSRPTTVSQPPTSSGGLLSNPPTVKLTPPIYNTPPSQSQKKTVWKQRSPQQPQHSAQSSFQGSSLSSGANQSTSAATPSTPSAISISPPQHQPYSAQSAPPQHQPQHPRQQSPLRGGMPGPQPPIQNGLQPIPAGARATSPPRSPTRSGPSPRVPPPNMDYQNRARPQRQNPVGASNTSQRALFTSLPPPVVPPQSSQGLFQPPSGGRGVPVPKQLYFTGSTPNLPTYIPSQPPGRRGNMSPGIPVPIPSFYPPFPFVTSASMPSLPAIGSIPTFAKMPSFPPPQIISPTHNSNNKYHPGGPVRASSFTQPGNSGHSGNSSNQQSNSGRDSRKDQKEREKEREKEKEKEREKEREAQKRKPKGMWKVKNRNPVSATSTSPPGSAGMPSPPNSSSTSTSPSTSPSSTSLEVQGSSASSPNKVTVLPIGASDEKMSPTGESARGKSESGDESFLDEDRALASSGDSQDAVKESPSKARGVKKKGSDSDDDGPNPRNSGGNDRDDKGNGGGSYSGQPTQGNPDQNRDGNSGTNHKDGQQQQKPQQSNGSENGGQRTRMMASGNSSEDQSFSEPPLSGDQLANRQVINNEGRRVGGVQHQHRPNEWTRNDTDEETIHLKHLDNDSPEIIFESNVDADGVDDSSQMHQATLQLAPLAALPSNGRAASLKRRPDVSRDAKRGNRKDIKKASRKADRPEQPNLIRKAAGLYADPADLSGVGVESKMTSVMRAIIAYMMVTAGMTSISLVSLVCRLHKDALRALCLTPRFHVPLGLLYIYVYPSLAASVALAWDATWAPALLWYSYVGWFALSKPRALTRITSRPSATLPPTTASNSTPALPPKSASDDFVASKIGARVIVALLFLFEGVDLPSAIMQWGDVDRLLLGLAFLSTKSMAYLHKRCFLWLAAVLTLNHCVSEYWIEQAGAHGQLVLQWAVIVISLSNHYVCSQTPKQRPSCFTRRLRCGHVSLARTRG